MLCVGMAGRAVGPWFLPDPRRSADADEVNCRVLLANVLYYNTAFEQGLQMILWKHSILCSNL